MTSQQPQHSTAWRVTALYNVAQHGEMKWLKQIVYTGCIQTWQASMPTTRGSFRSSWATRRRLARWAMWR